MGQQLHIKAWNRSYVQAINGGGSTIRCTAPWPREWETFTLAPLDSESAGVLRSGARVRLRSHTGQRIACAPDGTLSATGPLHAGPLPNDNDTFTLVLAPGEATVLEMFSRFGLRAPNGKYVCAENGGGGRLVANSDAMSEWATFTAELHPEPPNTVLTVHLRTTDGYHFLHAKNGGGGELTAEATAAAQWETFDVLAADGTSAGFPPNARVHLRSYNGYYVQALNGGGSTVGCAAPWGREWETFTLVLPPGVPALRPGSAFGLRTADGHYLSAVDGGGGAITARAQTFGPTETFTDTTHLDYAQVYGAVRKALLSRYFAVGKFFRTNFIADESRFGRLEIPKTRNRVLTLTRLICHETEDFTGPDDCYLKINVDGSWRPQLAQRMNTGQDWLINVSYKFGRTIEIELYDEDSLDRNDCLGRVTIDGQIQPLGQQEFKKHGYLGYHYTLQYTVAELNPPEVAPELHVADSCCVQTDAIEHDWTIAAHLRENPLINTGQLLLCLAVEHYLGSKEALPIMRSALEALATLYKFSRPHFKGYILRWDAVTSDLWTTVERNGRTQPDRCLNFLTDADGRYLYCTPFDHPDYITDKNDAPGAQQEARYAFCSRYRSWEPSIDEINGLLMGYDIAYELVADPSVRALIKEQVTNLADYLAEHSYMLVRPAGGFTLRGAAVPGPAFEYPYGLVFARITGDRYAARGGWIEAMKKAGLWNKIADHYHVATAAGVVAETIDFLLPDGLETIALKSFWNSYIPEVTKLDLARAVAIYSHRDIFDVRDENMRSEFALAYLASVVEPPQKRFAIYLMGSARDIGGYGSRMPRFIAVSAAPLLHPGIDSRFTTLSRTYVQDYHPPNLPEDMRTFITATGVLLELGAAWESTLVQQLAQLAARLTNGLTRDLGGRAEQVEAALNYMSALAIAWLYRKKLEERNHDQTFAPAFPALPDMRKWPAPAVPRRVINAATAAGPGPKPILPLHLIQRGRDASNLVYNAADEAELFVAGAIPPKSPDPMPPTPPISYVIVPDVCGLTATIASQQIRKAGLSPKYKEPHLGTDFVWQQSPRADTRVPRGSTVSLQCRSGSRL